MFDDAIALQPAGENEFQAHTHPAFGNMVGPYGGVTNATLLNAILSHPQLEGEPLALTVNFLAPLAEGSYEISAVPVRTNRTNQHWVLSATQNGDIVATGTAVTGVLRDTWSDTERQAPPAPAPEDLAPLDTRGFPFAWLQTVEMRFVNQELSLQRPLDSSETTLWLRHVPERPWDHAALASMADAFVPRIFLRRGPTASAGTVSITTYFHAGSVDLAGVGDFVLGEATASRFHRGMYDQQGVLFSRDGQLLATTSQLVYFKER